MIACIAAGGTVLYAITRQAPARTDSHDDYVPLTFSTFASFRYEVPEQGLPPAGQIPAQIKSFNGWRIAVTGFMTPIELKNGRSKRFLITCKPMGCRGPTPRINEFIDVRMAAGKTMRANQDNAVTVFGVLTVAELIENGEVTSIYRLEADDVGGALDL
jgi:hypothetical protein